MFSFSMSFNAAAREWDLTLPSLKEVFADYFPIGNILEPNEIADGRTTDMFLHHYNFLTAENAMKPVNIARTPGEWDFGMRRLDLMVDWALENDVQVVGHTLVWHSQSAPWLTGDEDGNPLTRAEARDNMERYINAVAGHFAGRIYSWDVVNEALLTSVGAPPPVVEEGWWKDVLRTEKGERDSSPWYAAYANGMDEEAGEHPSDYIYDAFVFTRIADPNAILYYNDFNETSAGKREAMAQMTEELNARWLGDPRNDAPGRLLVEGLGMQAHYWTADLNPINVEMTILRFAQTGAIISITELDIPMGRYGGFEAATEENLRKQADLYRDVFEVLMRHADKIERVTLWGKADPQSWRSEGSPLLFNGSFEAKDSFTNIVALAQGPQIPVAPDAEIPDDDNDDPVTEVAVPSFAGAEAQEETNDSGIPWKINAIACGAVLLLAGIILLNVRK
ncbi:MAG: endo-1,4-beta-xylanase [Oscillospiraceae bacterium]|nr:endo-1,4-beta-xylanase [Oscillospiraceae bacterium]